MVIAAHNSIKKIPQEDDMAANSILVIHFFGTLCPFFFLYLSRMRNLLLGLKKCNDLGSSAASIIKSHDKMCRDLTDSVV